MAIWARCLNVQAIPLRKIKKRKLVNFCISTEDKARAPGPNIEDTAGFASLYQIPLTHHKNEPRFA